MGSTRQEHTEGQGNGDVNESGGTAALEPFFDIVFAFAFTQVTGYLSGHLTWEGVLQGAALLAALWWAWVCYSWLTNEVPAGEVMPARLVILAAMAAMLVAALAVPDAFGESGVLFGVAYFVVRFLHVVLYALSAEPETRGAVLRVAPGFLGGAVLLVVAGFLDGLAQGALWALALAIDYGAPLVLGVRGFWVQEAGYFADRYQSMVRLALGLSIASIATVGLDLDSVTIVAALVAFAVSGGLWWAYFDYVALAAEQKLASTRGHERTKLARDSYSYLHLTMVAGIVFVALGFRETLADVGDPLGTVAAVALCGGAALYLLGHNAFRFRDHGSVNGRQLFAAALCCVLAPVALQASALVTLALLAALLAGLATLETVRPSESRQQVRAG